METIAARCLRFSVTWILYGISLVFGLSAQKFEGWAWGKAHLSEASGALAKFTIKQRWYWFTRFRKYFIIHPIFSCGYMTWSRTVHLKLHSLTKRNKVSYHLNEDNGNEVRPIWSKWKETNDVMRSFELTTRCTRRRKKQNAVYQQRKSIANESGYCLNYILQEIDGCCIEIWIDNLCVVSCRSFPLE